MCHPVWMIRLQQFNRLVDFSPHLAAFHVAGLQESVSSCRRLYCGLVAVLIDVKLGGAVDVGVVGYDHIRKPNSGEKGVNIVNEF